MTDSMTIDGKTFALGETVPADAGVVQTEVWRRVLGEDGKPTGRIIRVAGRPIVDVVRDVIEILTREDLIDEYATLATEYRYENMRAEGTPLDWPSNVWNVACWSARGGSEGDYVHVDVIPATEVPRQPSQRFQIMTVKTFQGADHGWKVARRIAQLLGFSE